MTSKLAALTTLEKAAAVARRLRLGALVDQVAPLVGRRFERFTLDVHGVRLSGTTLPQLHYVRELLERDRERTFVQLLTAAVPQGGTVLEGGAYLGYVTVHLANAVGRRGRVVAFEPNAEVRPLLLSNLGANAVADRVTIVPKALGAVSSTARFYLREDMSSLVQTESDVTPTEVEVARADDEIAGPIDVVKLDLEGGETGALQGMERLLRDSRGPRAIFVECFPRLLEAAGSSAGELIEFLERRGYQVEWIDEAGGRAAPLSERWLGDYVNLRCTREA